MLAMFSTPEYREGLIPPTEKPLQYEQIFETWGKLPENLEDVQIQSILPHFVNPKHLDGHPEIAAVVREYITMNDTDLDKEEIEIELVRILTLIQTVKDLKTELEKQACPQEMPQALLMEAHNISEMYQQGKLTPDGLSIDSGRNYWRELQDRSSNTSLGALFLYLSDVLFCKYSYLRAAKRRLNQPVQA